MKSYEQTSIGYPTAIPIFFAAALFVYKTRASLAVIRSTWSTGAIAGRPGVVAFDNELSALGVIERSVNYFMVIWPALVFGICIAAAVRAFVSPSWLSRLLKGKSMKTQLASLAGTPLMLCSCCIAPVFTSVAQSSGRLGPALGLMLASPALNPAALALTFMLFQPNIAALRFLAALIAVLAIGPAVEQMFPSIKLKVSPRDAVVENSHESVMLKLLRSVGVVTVRTIPGLVAGVLISMVIVQWLPEQFLATQGSRVAAVLVTATLATPLALPTFLEIPLALSLLALGFPPGAAVALLFAGPAINLASLISIARVSGWKAAAVVAAMVWILAAGAGLLAG